MTYKLDEHLRDYVEMMRHYFPTLPIQAIRDAYKHNATPTEVRRHLERIEGRTNDTRTT